MSIKCLVVNLTFGKQTIENLSFRPCVGDSFAISYANEKVKSCVIITPTTRKVLQMTDTTIDMIVYTE